MKKTVIVLAILTLVATICIFTSCSTNTNSDISTSNTESPSNLLKPFHMEEEDLMKLYLKLHAKKTADYFIADEEFAIYEQSGFKIHNANTGHISLYNKFYNEITDYYYPIVVSEPEEEIVIAYINQFGCLCTYNISKNITKYYSNIHVQRDIEYIDYNKDFTIVHTEGSVELWQFGIKTDIVNIPNGAIFAGKSSMEGYIFRDGSTVYSVMLEQDKNNKLYFSSEPIAYKVKEVITADYKLNSDAWSQPLFIMHDGSIKAYCNWHGGSEAPRDDSCHLSVPQYEGGYK